MKVYTLVFEDRPVTSLAGRSLNGPYLFETEVETINKLFGYVRGRIWDSILDLFIENADTLGINIFDCIPFDDEPVTFEEYSSIMDVANTEVKKDIIGWYFSHVANDDENTAYFDIQEKDISIIDDFVDYLNNYITKEVDKGAFLSEVTDHGSLKIVIEAFSSGAR